MFTLLRRVAQAAAFIHLLFLAAPGHAETRVALVIGQSSYKNVARLPNPITDAQAIAASLRKIGFTTVQVKTDLDKSSLEATLQAFAVSVRDADVALIYFAGHGVEVAGINYLVPINARLASDSDVQFEAVSLDLVLSTVSSARQIKMVVLDACRDNPFLVSMRRTSGTRSVGRGLARIEPDAGTLVAYAAREGSTAADGDGKHSPFARAFMNNINVPGVEVRLLFGKIRDDVMEATGQKQEPATYASLGGRPFYFVPGPLQPVAPVSTGVADASAVEAVFWKSIADSRDAGLYRAYLRSYPTGTFVATARQRIAALSQSDSQEAATKGLEGAWNGVYRYAGTDRAPVQFALLVNSTGRLLTGSISEPNTFGDQSTPFLSANIEGVFDGKSVRFTKRYDGTGGQSHTVEYTGVLNTQTNVINGRWTTGGIDGTFELRLKKR